MSKRQLIILLGALIIIIALFSGLPTFWNRFLYIFIGILIIAIAYTTRSPQSSINKNETIPFVDTKVDANHL